MDRGCWRIRGAQNLTHPMGTVQFIWEVINSDERDIMLGLFAGSIFVFVLLLIALVRGRKLKKQVDALHVTIQALARAEEKRLHKERRGGR
jgi:hypothetical protein